MRQDSQPDIARLDPLDTRHDAPWQPLVTIHELPNGLTSGMSNDALNDFHK